MDGTSFGVAWYAFPSRSPRPTRSRMAMNGGFYRLSIAILASSLLVLAASPLAAQTALRRTQPDTLGLAPDTVRMPVGRVLGMGRCQISGHAVVKDRADLRRLRRYWQCAKVAPSLEGRTVVGLDINADCQAMYRIDAFRSAKRREFRVQLRIRGGTCRGLLPRYEWISLPALPSRWSVRISEVDENGPPDLRGWTPLDASRH